MLVIFDAIAAASNNFTVLVIFRFLAGVGGSGVLAVGAGKLSCLLSRNSQLMHYQVLFPTYGTQRTQVE